MNRYERPFELDALIEIEPKPGVVRIDRGDHITLENREGVQNYDPREVLAYLQDLLKQITADDDNLLWQVRHILPKEA